VYHNNVMDRIIGTRYPTFILNKERDGTIETVMYIVLQSGEIRRNHQDYKVS
jgi:hypothetical protein